MATCSSAQSRNNTVGLQLGQGKTITEVLASTNMVAEGVKTASTVVELAEQRRMALQQRPHARAQNGAIGSHRVSP